MRAAHSRKFIVRIRKLTKRLELSFLDVLALPNASSIGLVCKISYSIPLPPPRAAKYCIAIFAVSVFPAPLSPLVSRLKLAKGWNYMSWSNVRYNKEASVSIIWCNWTKGEISDLNNHGEIRKWMQTVKKILIISISAFPKKIMVGYGA